MTRAHHQRVPESYLGHRYHVYSLTCGLEVPGGDPGLVLALRCQLLTGSNLGNALCAHRRPTGGCRQAVPLICNSDQGSHFTSPQDCQLLLDANIQRSQDGKGRALDNIFTERLWRTVKYEEVYMHDYTSPREARQALTRYFAFDNQERPHQALENQTPAEVYFHQGAGMTTPL